MSRSRSLRPSTPTAQRDPSEGRSAGSPSMKIALLGTRGIPASYGGFETFAEELSRRLVERGHRVTVYCRDRHPQRQYLGVDLQYLPTIRHKYFDTIAHTFLSTLHLLFHRARRRSLLQRRERDFHVDASARPACLSR